jgi:hypothetical protein
MCGPAPTRAGEGPAAEPAAPAKERDGQVVVGAACSLAGQGADRFSGGSGTDTTTDFTAAEGDTTAESAAPAIPELAEAQIEQSLAPSTDHLRQRLPRRTRSSRAYGRLLAPTGCAAWVLWWAQGRRVAYGRVAAC